MSPPQFIDSEIEHLLEQGKKSHERLPELFIYYAHAAADHIGFTKHYLPQIAEVCALWAAEYPVAAGLEKLSSALGSYYTTRFSEAQPDALAAIAILEGTPEKDLLGVGHMIAGSNYRSLGEMDEAVKHLLVAIEQINPDGTLSVYACYSYYQLAEINVHIRDYDAAQKNYQSTIELAERSNQVVPLFRAYNGLGNLAMNQKEWEQAERLFNLSLNLDGMTASQLGRGTCDLGKLYFRMGFLDRAVQNLQESYQTRIAANLEDAASTSLIYWGEVLLAQGKAEAAIEKLLAALEITKKFESKAKTALCYKYLWRAYEQNESWKDSVATFKEYDRIQSEVHAVELRNIYRLKNRKIQEQKEEIEEKNKEITDSITYAKRIQEAILPPLRLVKERIENSFILYKPKDIVAGDFYWMEPAGDWTIFAAADCTGHGVPGAMVSVVCSNALNRSVREFELNEPAKILDKTLELVIERFEKSEEEVKDGMDIALCAFNNETKELQYAGANNALWIVTQRDLNELGEDAESRKLTADSWKLYEVKADKQPIGKYHDPQPYSNHRIQLQEGDSIYIFSDGYADQFGGPKGKKLKYKPFKQLILSNQDKSMDQQKELFNNQFEDWKGEYEQVDDVCLIGMKV